MNHLARPAWLVLPQVSHELLSEAKTQTSSDADSCDQAQDNTQWLRAALRSIDKWSTFGIWAGSIGGLGLGIKHTVTRHMVVRFLQSSPPAQQLRHDYPAALRAARSIPFAIVHVAGSGAAGMLLGFWLPHELAKYKACKALLKDRQRFESLKQSFRDDRILQSQLDLDRHSKGISDWEIAKTMIDTGALRKAHNANMVWLEECRQLSEGGRED